MDRTGTLMIKPNQCSIDPDEINVNYPHYNYNQSSDDESEELSFEAKFIKIKTYKELDNATIGLGKDLHRLLEHVHKLPDNPPVRDRAIFNKKEKYRATLIDHLDEIHSVEEFQFFSGSQSTELVNCNDSGNKKIETSVSMTHEIRSFNTSKTVHIRDLQWTRFDLKIQTGPGPKSGSRLANFIPKPLGPGPGWHLIFIIFLGQSGFRV